MSHDLFKRQIYAGLVEILHDKKYFYHSNFGDRHCKFTEEGEKALLEYFTMMGPWIYDKEKQELDKRAKALVVEELKR